MAESGFTIPSSFKSTIYFEEFTEALLLRPLPDRKVLAHFHFWSSAPPSRIYGRHHHIFPKSIYQQGFLHIDEYPPDANQGFDVPSAVIRFDSATNMSFHDKVLKEVPMIQVTEVQVLSYTEVLLVPLTTTDFSMHYNVITITCTVFALYFGSLLNALRRRVGEEENLTSGKGEAIALGLQHYMLALGTVVMIPTFLVQLMGGTDDDKVRVVQTLLFVGGMKTLLQTLFGMRLPNVIGGSWAFMVPIISIIHDPSLQRITNPHVTRSPLE